MSSGRFNLKQKGDATTPFGKVCRTLEDWPRRLATANAGDSVAQQERFIIAGQKVKWFNHLGRQLGSFFQDYIYSYHII